MDTVVLVVVAVGATILRQMEHPLWWVLLIVVGHFFLFCNVIRMWRALELAWAVSFILVTGMSMWLENLSATTVLACQLPITAALAFAEMRSRRYHGIFARRLNPRLGEYLKERLSKRLPQPSKGIS